MYPIIDSQNDQVISVQYFYVYQNKSYKEESKLHYLWAPKKGNNGHKISHWDMMTNVKKGDFIIHSYHQRIVAISRALTDCYSAPRPLEKGDHWNNDGWRVENEYFIFSNPILSKEHRENLLSLQPNKNAPFDKDGSGNMGYLYSANKNLFDYVVQETMLNLDVEERERFFDFVQGKSRVAEIELKLDNQMEEDVNVALEFIPIAKEYNPIPEKRPEPIRVEGTETYPRNKFNAANALLRAECKCEIDPDHPSFLRKSTKRNYTEPHHLIPMAAQKRFENCSLDIEANIVSLCSNCHNQIHYGVKNEVLLKKLFELRKDQLLKAGIEISFQELVNIYSGN